ncbi:MAG: alpha-xylosidase [Anaerocolumna sp.]
MKFTDGYWKAKEDVMLYQASAAVDIGHDDKTIVVYAPGHQMGGRKGLGGITLKVTYFSPRINVIGVRISHHEGKIMNGPSFVPEVMTNVYIEDVKEYITMTSGELTLKVHKGNEWNIEFSNKAGFLTKSSWRSAGYAANEAGENYIKEELALGIGEYVYGLGERFTSFIKNGQVVDIWNQDGGTSSEQAYKNIPFYITNRGYGVLVNDTGKVSFEVASEKVERVQFSAKGEELEYYIINGPTMMDVIKNYTKLTGKPALPPAWSFGLWLTTSFTTDYDEKTVTGFINGMKEREIPLQVFHFDCFWMKGSHWCNFDWDEKVFPEPEKMLCRLKKQGLKICVWINSYIAQRSRLFNEGMEKGYLLKRTDGSVWQTDEWQPGMGIVDFTNQEACKWYKAELSRLLDMGVDTFKTDFGERIPAKDVIYFDGSDPEKMHNYYAFLYNKVVFELLEEVKGKNNALVFARSATAGSQQFPVHWGGDCVASYESMAESLRGGLSLASCGFGYWSHDMGGFESCATADLYKRWVAFGMLSSHSRLHGNSSYRVPWLFDEEAVDVLRFFTNLKCTLMPYIYSMAVKTHIEGIPMMSSMVMHFMEDPTAPFLDRQYMLGDSILVAPVFDEKGYVEYYLPKGKWTNLLTNQVLSGGWQKERYDYMGLPVMIKENSIIPIGYHKNECVYDYMDEITFHIFELTGKAEMTVYTEGCEKKYTITAELKGKGIQIKSDCDNENFSILLRNIYKVASVHNGIADLTEEGIKIIPVNQAEDIVIQLA